MPRYAVESARRDETPARRGASPVPGNGAPAARGDNARRDSARHDGPLVTWWRAQHAKPLVDYGVIMVVIGLLTSLGLVVAYSTTTTWSVVDDDATVWSSAVKQTVFVLIGLVAMWIAMRLQLDWVRRLSPLLMGISIVLLFVVLLIGTGGQEVGSQSWLQLGPVSFQPSELARVSIAIWGSHYLAGRVAHGSGLDSHQWIFIGVSALTCGLIFWQGDVGMTATTLLVVIALLFFTGMSWKWFTGGAIVALAAIVLLVTFGSGYRVERITTFFDALTGHFEETRSSSFQSYQGFLSLGDGGLLGLGLGQSRAKWYYLPRGEERLRLRGHRRGARLVGRDHRHRPVRNAGDLRLPHRHAQQQVFHGAHVRYPRGRHRLPGFLQHRVRHRLVPGDGRSAAAAVLWWYGDGHHARCTGARRFLCQARTGGDFLDAVQRIPRHRPNLAPAGAFPNGWISAGSATDEGPQRGNGDARSVARGYH